jgi:hypothetical protein
VVTAGAAVGAGEEAGDVGAAHGDGVGGSVGPRSGLGHRTITPRGGTTILITSTRTRTVNAKQLWRGRSSRLQKNIVDQACAAYIRGDGHERAFRNIFDRIECVRIYNREVVQTHGILTGNFFVPCGQ